MKIIIFSKQCDADADLLPLWYWWYTNVFKADQIIILGAAVKGSTSIEKVAAFWKDKDVVYNEIIYDSWFAPRVWIHQKERVAGLLPKDGYIALSVDTDEFFEPIEKKHIKGNSFIVFEQERLWTMESLTTENVQTIPIYSLEKGHRLLNAGCVRRGAYINNFSSKTIKTAGMIRDVPSSGLSFFHFHFRGLEWFKHKFGKMKYAVEGRGASFHWKNYTRLIEDEETMQARYDKLVLKAELTSDVAERFREYFDK